MTENEFNVVKDIIAMITQKRNNAEMREMMASNTDEANHHGAEAWTLEHVLLNIDDILYIHKKHQRQLDEQEEIDRIDDLEWHSQYGQERDIASMEQGHGGE